MDKNYHCVMECSINKTPTLVIDLFRWNEEVAEAGLYVKGCTIQQKLEIRDTLYTYSAFVYGGLTINKEKLAGIVAIKRFVNRQPIAGPDKLEDLCHEGAYWAYVSLTQEFVDDCAAAPKDVNKRLVEREQGALVDILCPIKIEENGGNLYSDDEMNYFINGIYQGVQLRAENKGIRDLMKELFPYLTDINFNSTYF